MRVLPPGMLPLEGEAFGSNGQPSGRGGAFQGCSWRSFLGRFFGAGSPDERQALGSRSLAPQSPGAADTFRPRTFRPRKQELNL